MVIFDAAAFWQNLFDFGTFDHVTISLAEKIVRPIVVYALLVLLLRKMGKRILAQLNPFDLVVLLMLSNTVQNAIIGNDSSLLGGVVGAASLIAVNAVAVRWFYRGARPEHQVLEENDVYLIRDYRADEEVLKGLRINLGELTARAHERGFDDLSEVETAVLYPNGTIYMKGAGSSDSAQLAEIRVELTAIRETLAALRR
ncbi:MAG: YetF domain-containing protein [Vicinamibacterales bacterium]